MGYYIDLEKITIDEYKTKLEFAYLPPSRMMLKENREERFAYFKSIGINNVKELIQLLKKKDKLSELQKVECLSGNYLAILLRELNSILPKPNRIKDFTGLPKGTADRLEKIGIKNTLKLYDRILNSQLRIDLSEITGIPDSVIIELTKLTDLSRIKWVGVTFARMLYDIGSDTVEKASEADPIKLHQRINQNNKEHVYFKGQIGLNDIKIFIDAAKEIPLDIEY